MGWFQHGSTIIVFAPQGFTLCGSVRQGAVIRMGQRLMRLPSERWDVMRILIATDAWSPQVNGVVRSLQSLAAMRGSSVPKSSF